MAGVSNFVSPPHSASATASPPSTNTGARRIPQPSAAAMRGWSCSARYLCPSSVRCTPSEPTSLPVSLRNHLSVKGSTNCTPTAVVALRRAPRRPVTVRGGLLPDPGLPDDDQRGPGGGPRDLDVGAAGPSAYGVTVWFTCWASAVPSPPGRPDVPGAVAEPPAWICGRRRLAESNPAIAECSRAFVYPDATVRSAFTASGRSGRMLADRSTRPELPPDGMETAR